MLNQVRQNIVNNLWGRYKNHSPQIKLIEDSLKRIGVCRLVLDHFAIIDLPGPHTGIRYLSELFSCLGYHPRGRDYLPDKQNDFLWMAESDSGEKKAAEALPQVVVADFRLEEMPPGIKKIIEKYGRQSPPCPQQIIQKLASQSAHGDLDAEKQLNSLLLHYFSGRDWPLPTINEFHTVQEFNELLAWVMVFGRRPNHFTLSIHLLEHFADLNDFHQFIENDVQLSLNHEGGVIKGGKTSGIAQSSTMGQLQTVKMADGAITLPAEFVEFVWRFPLPANGTQPVLWKDYFTGFIAQHADHVIESLYT